ncbi:hypothetical protein PVAP13_2KG065532 [Panicum virgatum]|uniref:Uncharacterized protein n=1 Tax=Panicum virgatum TaxID=38727 RepID=A0A8T0W9Z6_PANVG|nr:hypothetical protein PVAP13_2KG065532 [Panicum virgatum]
MWVGILWKWDGNGIFPVRPSPLPIRMTASPSPLPRLPVRRRTPHLPAWPLAPGLGLSAHPFSSRPRPPASSGSGLRRSPTYRRRRRRPTSAWSSGIGSAALPLPAPASSSSSSSSSPSLCQRPPWPPPLRRPTGFPRAKPGPLRSFGPIP